MAGNVLLQADWSQMEAALTAFFARDSERMEIVLSGGDLYAHTAAALYRATEPWKVAQWNGCQEVEARALLANLFANPTKENAKAFKVEFQGGLETCRQATKRAELALGYGMQENKMALQYGWSVEYCKQMVRAYLNRWPAIARWQLETAELASRQRFLINPFGRRRYFWAMVPKDKHGEPQYEKWPDRNKALAQPAQSTGGGMFRRVLADAELPEPPLYTYQHDNFVLEVEPQEALPTARLLKRLMERKWPQMIWDKFYPNGFWCPVEFKVGKSWGEGEVIEVAA